MCVCLCAFVLMSMCTYENIQQLIICASGQLDICTICTLNDYRFVSFFHFRWLGKHRQNIITTLEMSNMLSYRLHWTCSVLKYVLLEFPSFYLSKTTCQKDKGIQTSFFVRKKPRLYYLRSSKNIHRHTHSNFLEIGVKVLMIELLKLTPCKHSNNIKFNTIAPHCFFHRFNESGLVLSTMVNLFQTWQQNVCCPRKSTFLSKIVIKLTKKSIQQQYFNKL